jgi:hypothetical protein
MPSERLSELQTRPKNIASEETLAYNYFGTWFSRLYHWVECDIAEKRQRIELIIGLCNKRLPGIAQAFTNPEYEGTVEDAPNHIRFPPITADFKLSDRVVIPIQIRIRINPCISAEHPNTDYPRHSKIWVITRNIKPVFMTGIELASVFKAVNDLSSELEEQVRSCYVPAIGEVSETEPKPRYRIFMKIASLADDINIREIYRRALNTSNPESVVKDNPSLKKSLSDVVRFTRSGNGMRLNEKDAFEANGTNDLWQITSGPSHQTVYRLSFLRQNTDISGLCYVKDPALQSQLTFQDFTDIALKYSWGM